MTYRFSAIAASVLVLSIAIVATYYRFQWHFGEDSEVPMDEVAATLLLVFGGIVSICVGACELIGVGWVNWFQLGRVPCNTGCAFRLHNRGPRSFEACRAYSNQGKLELLLRTDPGSHGVLFPMRD